MEYMKEKSVENLIVTSTGTTACNLHAYFERMVGKKKPTKGKGKQLSQATKIQKIANKLKRLQMK